MRIVLIMKRSLFLLVVLVAGAACSPSEVGSERFTVVATTSVWADVVGALDTDGEWTIETLVPRGADPHDYAPSAAQVAMVQRADLVVANGLGLEEGLEDALRSAEADGARILWLAPTLDPLPLAESSGHGSLDPHVWLDPIRVGQAAHTIAVEVQSILQDDRVLDAAAAYAHEMENLTGEIELLLAGVEDRRLVTNHDAFGYFADRFGLEVLGTVVPGGSTVAEPSSREVALLIEVMREAGVAAIFVDVGVPHLMASAIADEFGGTVSIVELRTGSLAEDGEFSTLVGLLRRNAELIADALGGG